MQSRSTESVRSLDYSQESAIFETYLMGLVNEDEAVEVVVNGVHDVINTLEDALTVIRLMHGDYPASVPTALRRLIGLVNNEVAKSEAPSLRVLSFLRWTDTMQQLISDTSRTAEFIPIYMEESC